MLFFPYLIFLIFVRNKQYCITYDITNDLITDYIVFLVSPSIPHSVASIFSVFQSYDCNFLISILYERQRLSSSQNSSSYTEPLPKETAN